MALNALNASRPEVGSSRKRIDGLVTSSIPTDTRLRSPPLIPRTSSSPILLFLHASSPSSAITVFTRFSFSATDTERGNRSLAEYYVFFRDEWRLVP